MSNAGNAYNPSDPVQSEFLSALALGETGNSSFASTEGVGGSNLAGSATDAYGFPEWSGEGNSHAAGTYQFQPSTWDSIASQYGLNFSSATDQNAGAWYEAEQGYSQATGGQSLETALQNGNYGSVQSALAGIWPSVTGNQAAPQGLAQDLSAGTGSSNISPTSQAASVGDTTASQNAAAGSSTASGTGIIADIENFFVRGGLIVIGGIVIVVALWLLLSEQGVVPSPGATAKAAAAAI